ncbi:MAG: hypothetical protein IJ617_03885 [Oscillospiraceae bacterium]|nr:hypothetical protein [Oscillospiraceae bacterium]
MNDPYLLAIDIGTTNTKAALFRPDGTVVSAASRRHSISSPREGFAEHDAERVWWAETAAVCAELTAAGGVAEKIAAVAVSTLSPALLPVDKAGNALYPAMLYNLDRRSVKELEELGEHFPVGQLSTGPKILWLKRHEPELFDATACFVGAPTFLVNKLTGNMVADHACYTIAGMPYDAEHMRWDETMCAACGVTPELLPELKYGVEIGGYVTPEAAKATGLRAGTPVSVGTGDFPAECCSFGTVYAHSVRLTFGTTVGVNFGYNSSDPLFRDYDYAASMAARPKRRGGAMPNGCSTVDWAIRLISGPGNEPLPDERLLALYESVPAGANGVTLLPFLNGGNGAPLYRPEAKGVLFGLENRHAHGEIYRAALEGLAYSVRMLLDPKPGENNEAVAMAGGIRIPGLLQTVSDVTGYTLTPLPAFNNALVGDAFLAGMACGMFSGLEDVNAWLNVGEPVRPNPANREVYDRGFEVFKKLCDAMTSAL